MNRPSPDDMKAMQVMEYVEELEKEYKKLKEENKRLKKDLEYYIKFYDEHDWPIDRWAYDNEDGLLYEEWLY